MKNGTPATGRESSFYCSAEWHLYQMRSGLACPLYTWAFRLSKKSRVFSASAENVADYFNVNRKTANCALEDLAESGFLVADRIERFKPNVYKVIDHVEWAKRNPGRCIEKGSFPWEGEGDPLGSQLYAISGERTKFWPRQMTGLRKLGFSDQQIIERFRIFIDEANYTGRRWKHAYYDFHAHLKALRIVAPVPERPPRHRKFTPTIGVEEVGEFPDARDILREQEQGGVDTELDDDYPRLKDHLPEQENSDVGELPSFGDMLRDRKNGSTVPSRTGTVGAQSNGHGRSPAHWTQVVEVLVVERKWANLNQRYPLRGV